jgi:glycosyltransferase involved in cell wall biosynthesis
MNIAPQDSTLIALIVGDETKYANEAEALMVALNYFIERDIAHAPVIIVVDGERWFRLLESQLKTIKLATVIVMPHITHHPGQLANAALAEVNTTALGFVTLGSEISTRYANRDALCAHLSTSGSAAVAGYRSAGDGRAADHQSYLVHQDDQFSSAYPHAWLQMLDLVPMTNTILTTALCRQLGGFTEANDLQRMWWWEFNLRASRYGQIDSLPLQPVPTIGWHHIAFAEELSAPVDDNLRVMMRVFSEPHRQLPLRDNEFALTMQPSESSNTVKSAYWRALSSILRNELINKVARLGSPIRIAVLGGVNEPAHNQLCFFNYFSLMRDWNIVTWRSLLDERATFADLADVDLVIFSRTRNARGAALMRECAANNIRTLYMLDDNWFWLGREWDEYADIFTPGKPAYENFLDCVRHADTTLTYSAPLAEDLRPHAKSLALLPTNVNLSLFPARPQTKSRITTIGYVGSLRKNMMAFDALVNVANSRTDVHLFIMSNSLPPEFAAFDPKRLRYEPYQFNYEGYAATVTNAAPDILVAPVGRSRFEESKCPNKFLEITACGAVGVYTRAEPYLSHIVERETGLFADDSVASWTDAINQLIDSPSLRQQLSQTAYRQVSTTYSTKAVLPRFVEMLLKALG